MMRILSTAALTLTAAAVFSGCASAPTSPYAGTYSGTFVANNGGAELGRGNVNSVVVDANGNVSGSITLTVPAPTQSTTVGGTIAGDGNTTLRYKYTGGSDVTLSGKLTLSGNKATGTLNTTVPATAPATGTVAAGTVTLDLTRQ